MHLKQKRTTFHSVHKMYLPNKSFEITPKTKNTPASDQSCFAFYITFCMVWKGVKAMQALGVLSRNQGVILKS